MRKLSLLAAAAMVAGGSAFAMDGGGVSISGEANFGVKFAESDDDSKSELQFHHEFDVKFSASGTTDGGIGFGGSMSIDNTESVSGRTAVAAPTGYMVKATDLTPAGLAALEKKYGVPFVSASDASQAGVAGAITISEHDVIESGGKTTVSGYHKATVAGHTYTENRRPKIGESVAYARQVTSVTALTSSGDGATAVAAGTAFADGNVLTIGPKPTDGTAPTLTVVENTATPKEGQITVEDANYFYSVFAGTGTTEGTVVSEELRAQIAVTATRGGNAVAAGDGFQDDDIITIGPDPDGDGPLDKPTVTVGDDEGEISVAEANSRYHVFHSSVTVAGTATRDATEKKKASEAYIAGLNGSITEADSQSVDNHGEVYISMDMHKLTIGSDLDAADKVAGGLADPGFDGIGIDDVAEGVWGKSAADVRYDGDFGVASVAISYGDNKGDAEWAAGFTFNVDPVNFGAGFDSKGVMSIGMGFEQGQIAMNALYSTDSDSNEADNEAIACTGANETDDILKASYSAAKALICSVNSTGLGNAPDLKNQAMGVDVSYQMSEETSVVLVAAQHKKESAHISYNRGSLGSDNLAGRTGTAADSSASYTWSTTSTTVDAFGVGFSHDLGGGATLKAGAGSVDSNAVADLGITMKF